MHVRMRTSRPSACPHPGLISTVVHVLLPRLGHIGADRQALYRRAQAAAKNTAAGYETSGELVVGCMCIGQPRDEEEPIPQLDACIGNPDLWTLPQRPDRIRLAFVWYIAKRGWEALEHESAWSCVVRLDNAEKRGVPLPSDFAPEVAVVIEADAKDKGSFSDSQTWLAAQPSSGDVLLARGADPGRCTFCG